MSIKKTGNNRASRRGMSTDKFPSRKGLLKINEFVGSQVSEWKAWIPALSTATNVTSEYHEYLQVGPIVFLRGSLVWTGAGAGSNLTITNLPFPVGNTLSQSIGSARFRLDANNLTIDAADVTLNFTSPNEITFWEDGNSLDGTQFSNGGYIRYHASYQVASGYEYNPTQTIEEIIESSFFDIETTLKRDLGVYTKNVTDPAIYNGILPPNELLTPQMIAAGAIVEYGSNADGEYVKFENGLMLTSFSGRFLGAGFTGTVSVGSRFTDSNTTVSMPVSVSTSSGSPDAVLWNTPASFTGNRAILAECSFRRSSTLTPMEGETRGFSFDNTTQSFRFYNRGGGFNSGDADGIQMTFSGIGRWK